MALFTTMKHYYQREGSTFYLGDSNEILRQLPRKIAKLLLADYPYGVNWCGRGANAELGPIAGDDRGKSFDIRENVLKCLPVLATNAHGMIFVPFKKLSILNDLDDDGFAVDPKISFLHLEAWCKPFIGTGSPMTREGLETLLCFVNGRRSADAWNHMVGLEGMLHQLPWTLHDRPPRIKNHSAEKPIGLYEQYIRRSTFKGDLILDPVGGCGSVAIAAAKTGRRSLVIELVEKNLEKAAKRADDWYKNGDRSEESKQDVDVVKKIFIMSFKIDAIDSKLVDSITALGGVVLDIKLNDEEEPKQAKPAPVECKDETPEEKPATPEAVSEPGTRRSPKTRKKATKRTDLGSRIMKALSGSTKCQNMKSLAKKVGFKRKMRLRPVLDLLLKDGTIEEVKPGQFRRTGVKVSRKRQATGKPNLHVFTGDTLKGAAN